MISQRKEAQCLCFVLAFLISWRFLCESIGERPKANDVRQRLIFFRSSEQATEALHSFSSTCRLMFYFSYETEQPLIVSFVGHFELIDEHF